MNPGFQIPIFPEFRKINIGDREYFFKICKEFPSYSDYNFASLWSYNTEDEVSISNLNGNTAVRFSDYLTSRPFLSFLGTQRVQETIEELIAFAGYNNLDLKLELIPQINLRGKIEHLKETYIVKEDRNNFDYIFSLERIFELPGESFSKKRNKISRFMKANPEVIVKHIDLNNRENDEHLLYVFSHWGEMRETEDTALEFKAIKRLLASAHHFKLICIGVYIDGKLKAFTITEILPKHFALAHFTKADPKIVGIFEFLYKKTAEELLKKGCLYLNREQDLGLEGLRAAKLSWRPIRFLKKYTISKKSAN